MSWEIVVVGITYALLMLIVFAYRHAVARYRDICDMLGKANYRLMQEGAAFETELACVRRMQQMAEADCDQYRAALDGDLEFLPPFSSSAAPDAERVVMADIPAIFRGLPQRAKYRWALAEMVRIGAYLNERGLEMASYGYGPEQRQILVNAVPKKNRDAQGNRVSPAFATAESDPED